jgi:hypothetical protein
VVDRISVHVPDADAALEAALDESERHSRAAFLRRAVVAGGTIGLGGVVIAGLPAVAEAAPSPAQDARILNLVLLVEYLESAFYADAVRRGKLTGELLQFAKVVGSHEQAHAAFVKQALGKAAHPKPRFAFGRTTRDPAKFTAAALAVEDLSVAAYNGQAANLTKPALAAAAKIVSVEARHAAWIRFIAGEVPAPKATDTPVGAAAASAAIRQTGWVR